MFLRVAFALAALTVASTAHAIALPVPAIEAACMDHVSCTVVQTDDAITLLANDQITFIEISAAAGSDATLQHAAPDTVNVTYPGHIHPTQQHITLQLTSW